LTSEEQENENECGENSGDENLMVAIRTSDNDISKTAGEC